MSLIRTLNWIRNTFPLSTCGTWSISLNHHQPLYCPASAQGPVLFSSMFVYHNGMQNVWLPDYVHKNVTLFACMTSTVHMQWEEKEKDVWTCTLISLHSNWPLERKQHCMQIAKQYGPWVSLAVCRAMEGVQLPTLFLCLQFRVSIRINKAYPIFWKDIVCLGRTFTHPSSSPPLSLHLLAFPSFCLLSICPSVCLVG